MKKPFVSSVIRLFFLVNTVQVGLKPGHEFTEKDDKKFSLIPEKQRLYDDNVETIVKPRFSVICRVKESMFTINTESSTNLIQNTFLQRTPETIT